MGTKINSKKMFSKWRSKNGGENEDTELQTMLGQGSVIYKVIILLLVGFCASF